MLRIVKTMHKGKVAKSGDDGVTEDKENLF